MEPRSDAHISRFSALGTLQVSTEARQRDGGSTVRQEHVSRRRHNDGISHGTWTHRQEVMSQGYRDFTVAMETTASDLTWAELAGAINFRANQSDIKQIKPGSHKKNLTGSNPVWSQTLTQNQFLWGEQGLDTARTT